MAVALYARVSTTRQAEQDLSIPDQIRQIREWCKHKGLAVAKEYIEAGASATDDKRPEFQQMIDDALIKPAPFEAIIVHSLSRFFRDNIELGVYERRLNKNGVRLISITQPISDDPMGGMVKQFFAIFDTYSSQENSKHTLRAMKENARRGFFNGSAPIYGFSKFDTNIMGARGSYKKRLEINPQESATVRKIFELYVNGLDGCPMGMKQIVSYLNNRNMLMRGKLWRVQKISSTIRNKAYIGKYYFNKLEAKTGKIKPESEWILIEVEPIVDDRTFEKAQNKRESFQINKIDRSKVVKTLLTGSLVCGCCGASMTLATGKGGKYHYYKCTNKISKGAKACKSKNIPMEKADSLVIDALSERVFNPLRIADLLSWLKGAISQGSNKNNIHLVELKKQLKAIEEKQKNIVRAIEAGLPFDDVTKKRAQELKVERETILIELASVQSDKSLPINKITPKKIELFSKALKARLKDFSSGMAKSYLNILVDEIVYKDNCLTIKGNARKLAEFIIGSEKNKAGHDSLPSYVLNWRPLGGSNPCYRRERPVS